MKKFRIIKECGEHRKPYYYAQKKCLFRWKTLRSFMEYKIYNPDAIALEFVMRFDSHKEAEQYIKKITHNNYILI